MGTWVIEVTEFKSKVIYDLEVIWRPTWPQVTKIATYTYTPG